MISRIGFVESDTNCEDDTTCLMRRQFFETAATTEWNEYVDESDAGDYNPARIKTPAARSREPLLDHGGPPTVLRKEATVP